MDWKVEFVQRDFTAQMEPNRTNGMRVQRGLLVVKIDFSLPMSVLSVRLECIVID